MKSKVLIIAVIFLMTSVAASALAADDSSAAGSTASEADRDLSKRVTDGDSPRDSRLETRSKDADNAMRQSGMFKADDIVGQKVVSQNGEDLGRVENLVIAENGQVQYVILSEGAVLGVGGKLIPVPWQAANLRMRDDTLVTSIDKQQLQNAPSIENDNWAHLSSPDYEQRVHGYFGSTPLDSQGSRPGGMRHDRSGSPGMGTGTGSDR